MYWSACVAANAARHGQGGATADVRTWHRRPWGRTWCGAASCGAPLRGARLDEQRAVWLRGKVKVPVRHRIELQRREPATLLVALLNELRRRGLQVGDERTEDGRRCEDERRAGIDLRRVEDGAHAHAERAEGAVWRAAGPERVGDADLLQFAGCGKQRARARSWVAVQWAEAVTCRI